MGKKLPLINNWITANLIAMHSDVVEKFVILNLKMKYLSVFEILS